MTQEEFVAFRDNPGKTIRSDIRLLQREEHRPILRMDGVRIENHLVPLARLDIQYNPKRGSTTFNISVAGIGPICRLDVNGRVHRSSGRTHKQFLLTPDCPSAGLQEGHEPRPELESLSFTDLFQTFCELANISHAGRLFPPDEAEGV